ncbi:uncharacterized protein [Prorops nasuta]|uniref:uncharacterized protein n=1 Tax=Prorops nasuta TaxID=863751 RepID=UPI0034CF5D69
MIEFVEAIDERPDEKWMENVEIMKEKTDKRLIRGYEVQEVRDLVNVVNKKQKKMAMLTMYEADNERMKKMFEMIEGEENVSFNALLAMLPTRANEWMNTANDFQNKWNYPHCLGAIDGKHIVIKSPDHSGSEFYNYKGTFSIVLLAVVDANYSFIYVDVGCQGRISDGGVFRNSSFFKKLFKNELHLPSDNTLPNKDEPIPYVFVGDDAFPLSNNLMKPYSGIHNKGSKERIFNYRLSRARRIVENAFGILSSVFRVLRKPILLSPHKTTNIVMCCTLLHNFLKRSETSRYFYAPNGTFDSEENGELQSGSWRNNDNESTSMLPFRRVARRPGVEASNIRDRFANYFKTIDVLPWQNEC